MKYVTKHSDPGNWRPQARFHASIDSTNQLKNFNEFGGVGVFIDVTRAEKPDIIISGSLTASVCFWETQSRSSFVTKPKFSADLVTLRFVTNGQISYLRRDGEVIASSSVAALTGFDDVREVRASNAVSTFSATIALAALISAYEALTGIDHIGLPALEPIAEMNRPGMEGLLFTIRLVQRRLQNVEQSADLLLPLFQEVMSYQLLSVWPKQTRSAISASSEPASQKIQLAIEFIEGNLSSVLMLGDVAAAVGISVRALQDKFKKEIGLTPVQFIIERRLTRAHEDLISKDSAGRSIKDIALSWGFAHMGDFGQRYRRLFGCTPSQTRRDVGLDRQDGSS